jgi:hypothetical protein
LYIFEIKDHGKDKKEPLPLPFPEGEGVCSPEQMVMKSYKSKFPNFHNGNLGMLFFFHPSFGGAGGGF